MAENAASPMTMTQKIIAIAVTIIIISTVALPIIDDMKVITYVEEMNTSARYTVLDASEVITLSISDGAPAINGEPVAGIFPDYTGAVFVVSDAVVVSFSSSVCYLASPEMFPDVTGFRYTMSDGTLVFDSGTVTYTSGDEETTATASYDFVLIPSVEGDYGAWVRTDIATTPLYVDPGKPVYAYYGTQYNSIVAHGTVEEMEIDLFIRSGAVDTTTVMTIECERLSNEANQVLSLSFDPAFSSNIGIIAPLKYTVATTDNPMNNLIGIIPLILMLVPVMMGVRMIALRRN